MESVIQLEGLTRAFGKHTVVDHLNIQVNRGEIFGLLGPNGSGKTTTLNMINGLTRPSEGRVLVTGLDPAREPAKVRSVLGVVPQETALYNDLTARENLAFHAGFYGVPRRERQERIQRALDLVELAARQNDRVGNYSGGMRRRLALARTLLTEPQVIMLDEPTLGVDVQSRNSLWEHIRHLRDEGRTVIVTTNVMEEAEALCDRLVIIDHGKVVASGTPGELKARIGEQILELRVNNLDNATTAIRAISGVQNVNQQQDRLVLTVSDGPQLLPQLLAEMAERDVSVTSAILREPSLNDVFLRLTGRKLRD